MLKNKTIIITGAGRGIGRALAEVCAKEGAQLCLISRTESELKDTLERVKQFSKDSFYLVGDVSDENSARKCVLSAKEKLVNIDALINNAGIQSPIGPFIKNDISHWKKNIEINLFGTINMTYFVLPYMVARKKGKIINFSGGGATSPRANFSAYGASKTAIVRFTETLAEENKEFNVDINSIAPGAVNTKMLDEVIDAQELSGVEYQDALKRKSAGASSPYIAAGLVSFLVSDLSNGISGKLISAPWDSWKEENFQSLLRTDKDFATIRRIDNKSFYKKI